MCHAYRGANANKPKCRLHVMHIVAMPMQQLNGLPPAPVLQNFAMVVAAIHAVNNPLGNGNHNWNIQQTLVMLTIGVFNNVLGAINALFSNGNHNGNAPNAPDQQHIQQDHNPEQLPQVTLDLSESNNVQAANAPGPHL